MTNDTQNQKWLQITQRIFNSDPGISYAYYRNKLSAATGNQVKAQEFNSAYFQNLYRQYRPLDAQPSQIVVKEEVRITPEKIDPLMGVLRWIAGLLGGQVTQQKDEPVDSPRVPIAPELPRTTQPAPEMSAKLKKIQGAVDKALRERGGKRNDDPNFYAKDAYETDFSYVVVIAYHENANLDTVRKLDVTIDEYLTGINIDVTCQIVPRPLRVEVPKAQKEIKPALLKDYWSMLKRQDKAKGTFTPGFRFAGREKRTVAFELSGNRIAHVQLSGQTGSGKSSLARSSLLTFCALNNPQNTSLVIIDPKGEDFFNTDFERLPHLACPIINDPEWAVSAVRLVHQELQSRMKMGKQNFNRIILFVDEMAYLRMNLCDEMIEMMKAITAAGRSKNIHLFVATQKIQVDVIPGDIQTNLPLKLAGSTAKKDAYYATGVDGTDIHRLPGNGAFMAFFPSMDDGIRFQGFFVRDEDVKVLVDDIRDMWDEEGETPFQIDPENEVRNNPQFNGYRPSENILEAAVDNREKPIEQWWIDSIRELIEREPGASENALGRLYENETGKRPYRGRIKKAKQLALVMA